MYNLFRKYLWKKKEKNNSKIKLYIPKYMFMYDLFNNRIGEQIYYRILQIFVEDVKSKMIYNDNDKY